MLINSLYYFFTILVALGAITILLTPYIRYAILSLMGVIIGLSALYFLQGAIFVAIIQLTIHVGGILVLLVCSLWFIQPTLEIPHKKNYSYIYSVLAALCTILCLGGLIFLQLYPLTEKLTWPSVSMLPGTIQQVGYQIVGPYGLVLEIVSILLLIGLVGMLHIIVDPSYKKPAEGCKR